MMTWTTDGSAGDSDSERRAFSPRGGIVPPGRIRSRGTPMSSAVLLAWNLSAGGLRGTISCRKRRARAMRGPFLPSRTDRLLAVVDLDVLHFLALLVHSHLGNRQRLAVLRHG